MVIELLFIGGAGWLVFKGLKWIHKNTLEYPKKPDFYVNQSNVVAKGDVVGGDKYYPTQKYTPSKSYDTVTKSKKNEIPITSPYSKKKKKEDDDTVTSITSNTDSFLTGAIAGAVIDSLINSSGSTSYRDYESPRETTKSYSSSDDSWGSSGGGSTSSWSSDSSSSSSSSDSSSSSSSSDSSSSSSWSSD